MNRLLVLMLFVVQVFAQTPSLLNEEKNTIEVFQKMSERVVFIHRLSAVSSAFQHSFEVKESGSGSGILWDKQGYVLTNFHVVDAADKFIVNIFGASVDARLISAEPRKDIAVLKIDAPKILAKIKNLDVIELAPTSELQVGQKTLAIGNPFGFDHSLSVGVISALGRQVPGVGGVSIHDMIQTDAAINPGNSGGPLLDSSGRLIGMNTAIFSESGSSAGVGFAVPSDDIRRIVTQIIQHGHASLAGIGIQPVPPSIAKHLGVNRGILIGDVMPNSPAAQIGLRPTLRHAIGSVMLGDVIVSLNGHSVKDYDALYHVLNKLEIGSIVHLGIYRQGQIVHVSCKTIDISSIEQH